MGLFTNIANRLELEEAYAADNDGYCCEGDLSEAFDRDIVEHIIKQYGADDQPAINEGFNNWSDALRTDGELGSAQYDQYCYVGEHSDG